MKPRLLVSYAYYRNIDLGQLAAECGGVDLFADSGAFTAYTTGTRIDVDDYARWLTRWSRHLSAAANLDVIGDPAASARNLRRLKDVPCLIVPVFHIGSPWSVLHELCRNHPYVALGGGVAADLRGRSQMAWFIRCHQIAREHGAVLHGFGVTNRQLTGNLPFFSIDSTYWTDGLRFGKVTVWDDVRHRVIEIPFRDGRKLHAHARAIRDAGADISRLLNPAFMRASRRTPTELRGDRNAMVGLAAVAWTKYGQWLQDRHRVPAPANLTTPGTRLYLAAVGGRDPGDRAHFAATFRRLQAATLTAPGS